MSSLEDALWLNVSLGRTNLNLIKAAFPLASEVAYAQLALTGAAVRDYAGNGLTSSFWTIYEARAPRAFVGDATQPALESFDLDMDASHERVLSYSV